MTRDAPDSNDIDALRRQLAETQAKLAAAERAAAALASHDATASEVDATSGGKQTHIETGGGAAIQGAVQVRGGHFIGRDYVQFVTNVTNHGEDAEEAKSVIALYLHGLATDLAGLKLGQIDASIDQTRQSPLQLADIYVPLDTTQRIPRTATLAAWLARQGRSRPHDGSKAVREEMAEERETRRVSAVEALAEHRELTVLGKPGSGKSTFGASVLLALARAWQGHVEQLDALGEGWKKKGALLPIRVVLRQLAETLPTNGPARAGHVWNFIGRDLADGGAGASARTFEYVQRIARESGAVFLLDGLDECGDRERRQRVLAAVDDLKRHVGNACRFITTARPYAWPDGPNPAQGVYALADLDDEQIERFIRAWYAALVDRKWRTAGEVESKIDDLLAARQRPDLKPLAENPLLLTLMATLHTNRGRLPDDRADLYAESVDLLMLRWNQQIGADKALLDALGIPGLKLKDLREVTEKLAFDLHRTTIGHAGASDVAEHTLVNAFRPLLKSKDKADLVVDYIEKRAGLLVGHGEKEGDRQFAFPHRTFQEFLAACHLASLDDFPGQCVALAREAPAHWQVVLPLAARVAGIERGASAADELVGSRTIDERLREKPVTAADWACAALAGLQLQEVGIGAINARDRTRAIASRVIGWLAAALPAHPDEGGLPAAQRAQIGDVLAALGDPRFDPNRCHLPADDWLGFVHIPADPAFAIGTRKADRARVGKATGEDADDDEINDIVTPTPEFYIARFPVTVAQFKSFVQATQFEARDADALRDPESRPVRYVNWHEALAYAEWLTTVLATSSALGGSPVARLVREQRWQVTLPSELEWEKAARGEQRNAVFPWGDTAGPDRANYDDSNIDNTSAVGSFPANSFGLHDMVGNVWEWTRSVYGSDYPYQPDDGREDLRAHDDPARVVRGGAWYFNRSSARCAFRRGDAPDLRYDYVGFRVVLRSSLFVSSAL